MLCAGLLVVVYVAKGADVKFVAPEWVGCISYTTDNLLVEG